MTDKIKVSFLNTLSDKKIACIRLNKPKALNALDLDMVKALQNHLNEWRNNTDICAVFIDSEGDKAFCAGGDIVSMYHAMANEKAKNPNNVPDFMAQFFEHEYRLDYTIHAFPKPIICWGNGIIMGGGLGIFAGASHRIVTETARVAMPEITIGLFPDVGASFFLNKMPKGVGKFLGLTACSVNASDCLNIGLANYFLLDDNKSKFLDSLSRLSLVSDQSISAEITKLNESDNDEKSREKVQGNLSAFITSLETLDTLQDISDIECFLQNLSNEHSENKTLTKALQSFLNGSPITARLVIEQLVRGKTLTLAECFQMELSMAYQCSTTGEFQEGVRALLVDKDNQPNWLYKDNADIPEALIQAHFSRFIGHNGTGINETQVENPLQTLVAEFGSV